MLRRKLATFDVRQHEFRERFRKTAPFAYEADYVYARIDRVSPIACHDVKGCMVYQSLPSLQYTYRYM